LVASQIQNPGLLVNILQQTVNRGHAGQNEGWGTGGGSYLVRCVVGDFKTRMQESAGHGLDWYVIAVIIVTDVNLAVMLIAVIII
jgi:hypothetical protein